MTILSLAMFLMYTFLSKSKQTKVLKAILFYV